MSHATPLPFPHLPSLRLKLVRSSLLLFALGAAAAAPGQALATATQLSHISVFAESVYLAPNVYGNPVEHGMAAGIDLSRIGGPIPISFEARGTYAPTGHLVGQRSGTVGARLDLRHRRITRLQPYANFLVGAGEIVFGSDYNTGSATFHSDSSFIYNFGGGLDLAFTGNFAVQAEYQQQRWNLGNADNPQPFSPAMINVGLRYILPFRPRRHL